MLSRITLVTAGVAALCVTLLRIGIPGLNYLFDPLDVRLEWLGGLVLPLGTLLAGLVIGLLFRMVSFNRRISDMFSIRHRIDCNEILIPMALMATHGLTARQVDAIRQHRGDLIYKVFYRYASSGASAGHEDRELVESGVHQLFIYWALLEIVMLVVATALVLMIAGKFALACWLLLVAIATLVGVRFIGHTSARRSWEEVESILEDPSRKRDIAAVFEAL